MIKINGRNGTGWWFDGYRFSDDRFNMDVGVANLEGLRGEIITRAFGLMRWQGEPTIHGVPLSVGTHLLLTVQVIDELPWLGDRFFPSVGQSLARRLAAAHDLGEVLGLGDPAAPWLRSDDYVGLRVGCDQHQTAAEALFGLPPRSPSTASARKAVDYADKVAAAVERRLLFNDHSRDCESFCGEVDVRRFTALAWPGMDTGHAARRRLEELVMGTPAEVKP